MILEYLNKKEDGRFDYKMVIAVRQDLKLSKGKMSAQVAHACAGCVLGYLNLNSFCFISTSLHKNFQECKIDERVIKWFQEGQKKVVVKVSGLDDIMVLEKEAIHSGLINVVIEDFGLTKIPEGTITCIGIGPDTNEKIDDITGNLRLM